MSLIGFYLEIQYLHIHQLYADYHMWQISGFYAEVVY